MESWQQENHIECWVWWNLEFAPIYKTRGGPWGGTLLADERFWQVHITDQNVSSAHISKRCLSRRSGRVHSGWWWLLPNSQWSKAKQIPPNVYKSAHRKVHTQNVHKSEGISKRRGLSGREHSGWWWLLRNEQWSKVKRIPQNVRTQNVHTQNVHTQNVHKSEGI